MSRKNLALAPGVMKPKAPHVAEVIKDVPEYFAQDGFETWGARRLWRYRRGVYQPRGAETVAKYTKAILRANHVQDSWSTRLASETEEYLRTDAPELPNAPSLETLNVLNGLVDVHTGKLRPHDPTFLSTVQLPVIYVKDANCPAWERQIKETWPADAVEDGLPWAIIAYLMLPITALQKAILLLGEAGSGKSVFLASLIAFLGLANVSAVTLQKLEEDRFAASMLIGKLANVFADLPSQHLETSAIFKSITGGDLVPANSNSETSFPSGRSLGWCSHRTNRRSVAMRPTPFSSDGSSYLSRKSSAGRKRSVIAKSLIGSCHRLPS